MMMMMVMRLAKRWFRVELGGNAANVLLLAVIAVRGLRRGVLIGIPIIIVVVCGKTREGVNGSELVFIELRRSLLILSLNSLTIIIFIIWTLRWATTRIFIR